MVSRLLVSKHPPLALAESKQWDELCPVTVWLKSRREDYGKRLRDQDVYSVKFIFVFWLYMERIK